MPGPLPPTSSARVAMTGGLDPVLENGLHVLEAYPVIGSPGQAVNYVGREMSELAEASKNAPSRRQRGSGSGSARTRCVRPSTSR